ncbi:unnamed protein product [Peniophora sp. CBMAI 1063]|nr:unnamed protein product [Peniophora sp. CBMAI 1063]
MSPSTLSSHHHLRPPRRRPFDVYFTAQSGLRFRHYRLCSLREPTRQVLRQSELMRAGRDEAMCGTAFMLVGCLYGWKVLVY